MKLVYKKYTFISVDQYFKNNNCKLLENNYVNSTSKMKYICNNNHINTTNFSSFKRACNSCPLITQN